MTATPHTITTFWRALLATLALLVTWLALSPAPPQTLDSGWDKLNHLAAFAALALCTWRGYGAVAGGNPVWPHARRLGMSLLAYGLFIEVAQGFVPGRSAEAEDLLADALGITLGWALHQATARLQQTLRRADD